MIGNEQHAAEALAAYNSGEYADVFSYDGTDRLVFLIDGIIYKVEINVHGTNEAEYANYTKIKDVVSDPIRVPVTELYSIDGTNVIAMQYIKGEALAACYCREGEEHFKCLPDDVLDLVSPFIGDTGGMNVIANDKGYYIIDLAD